MNYHSITQKQYSLVLADDPRRGLRLSLYSRPFRRAGVAGSVAPKSKPKAGIYLNGFALDACRSGLAKILKEVKLNFDDLHRENHLDVPEELGLFFSLAFRVIQPVNDATWARSLLNELDAMAFEEIKYWLSKLTDDDQGRDFRVLRALRIMLDADRGDGTKKLRRQMINIRDTFDLTMTELSYLLEVQKSVVASWIDLDCASLPGKDNESLIESLSRIAERIQALGIDRFGSLARRNLFQGESLLVLIRNGDPIDEALEAIKAISEKEARMRQQTKGSGLNLRTLEDVLENDS